MQGNLAGFDATQVKPQESFELLPAGWYRVVITDSEFKPTKNGQGQYLELTLTVIEGDHEGRKVWARLNLDNPNQTAVEIAQRELSAICHAVGVLTPSDSTQLHDRPFEVKVSVRPARGDFEASNETKGYRAIGAEGSSTSAATTGAATRTPPSAAKATPPWKRKTA